MKFLGLQKLSKSQLMILLLIVLLMIAIPVYLVYAKAYMLWPFEAKPIKLAPLLASDGVPQCTFVLANNSGKKLTVNGACPPACPNNTTLNLTQYSPISAASLADSLAAIGNGTLNDIQVNLSVSEYVNKCGIKLSSNIKPFFENGHWTNDSLKAQQLDGWTLYSPLQQNGVLFNSVSLNNFSKTLDGGSKVDWSGAFGTNSGKYSPVMYNYTPTQPIRSTTSYKSTTNVAPGAPQVCYVAKTVNDELDVLCGVPSSESWKQAVSNGTLGYLSEGTGVPETPLDGGALLNFSNAANNSVNPFTPPFLPSWGKSANQKYTLGTKSYTAAQILEKDM